MRPRRPLATIFAAAILAVVAAGAARAAGAAGAEEAFRRGQVYEALYEVALVQWERAYDRLLTEAVDLGLEASVAPEFAFHAGLCAFDRGAYDQAGSRFRMAVERYGPDSQGGALAGLWSLGAAMAADGDDAKKAFRRQAVTSAAAEQSLEAAYILARLGLECALQRELVTKADQSKAELSGRGARRRAWMAFVLDDEPGAYVAAARARGAAPAETRGVVPKPAARLTGAERIARLTRMELYDAGVLRELAQVWFALARRESAADSEVHVEALLRLGISEEALRRAQRLATRGGGYDPESRIRKYRMRVFKAEAEEGLKRSGALEALRRRFINDAFAAREKEIYHAVARELAESLLRRDEIEVAVAVATAAVSGLEKNYRGRWPANQLRQYFAQTRDVYATLAHALYRQGSLRRSLEVYADVYPWHRREWISVLRGNPVFAVRYTAVLFERNDFALARELVYNDKDYGLLIDYPEAVQLHGVSSIMEYLVSQ